jgi:hypothetical protein
LLVEIKKIQSRILQSIPNSRGGRVERHVRVIPAGGWAELRRPTIPIVCAPDSVARSQEVRPLPAKEAMRR